MPVDLPPTVSLDRAKDDACSHRAACQCRRPTLGRALVASVAIQMVLALVTVSAGGPLVGLVACAAMTVCMVAAVTAEAVSFHRTGLLQPETAEIGQTVAANHRPGQAVW